MVKKSITFSVIFILLCVPKVLGATDIPVDQGSSSAGGNISIQGTTTQLYEGSLKVGDNFLDLVKDTDIDFPFNNRVTIVSTVPSIDTPVCELQTQEIGGSDQIDPSIDLITISRDLPFAQSRFAKESGLSKVKFVSDYKTGSFGKTAGLMIKGKEILARAVFVLDREGVIRYLQVVPELSHLPDITQAIKEANRLAHTK